MFAADSKENRSSGIVSRVGKSIAVCMLALAGLLSGFLPRASAQLPLGRQVFPAPAQTLTAKVKGLDGTRCYAALSSQRQGVIAEGEIDGTGNLSLQLKTAGAFLPRQSYTLRFGGYKEGQQGAATTIKLGSYDIGAGSKAVFPGGIEINLADTRAFSLACRNSETLKQLADSPRFHTNFFVAGNPILSCPPSIWGTSCTGTVQVMTVSPGASVQVQVGYRDPEGRPSTSCKPRPVVNFPFVTIGNTGSIAYSPEFGQVETVYTGPTGTTLEYVIATPQPVKEVKLGQEAQISLEAVVRLHGVPTDFYLVLEESARALVGGDRGRIIASLKQSGNSLVPDDTATLVNFMPVLAFEVNARGSSGCTLYLIYTAGTRTHKISVTPSINPETGEITFTTM